MKTKFILAVDEFIINCSMRLSSMKKLNTFSSPNHTGLIFVDRLLSTEFKNSLIINAQKIPVITRNKTLLVSFVIVTNENSP